MQRFGIKKKKNNHSRNNKQKSNIQDVIDEKYPHNVQREGLPYKDPPQSCIANSDRDQQHSYIGFDFWLQLITWIQILQIFTVPTQPSRSPYLRGPFLSMMRMADLCVRILIVWISANLPFTCVHFGGVIVDEEWKRESGRDLGWDWMSTWELRLIAASTAVWAWNSAGNDTLNSTFSIT